MLVVIYAKVLHHNFIPMIYEVFKSIFLFIYRKQKFGNLSDLSNWKKYFHWIIF